MKKLVIDIGGWMLTLVLLLPLLPLFLVGMVFLIISVPVLFLVSMPMVICGVPKSTLDTVTDAVKDVFIAPMRLFIFAWKGLSQALTKLKKENE